MSRCLFCYKKLPDDLEYHPACSEKFFGIRTVPELHLDRKILAELATRTANKRIAFTGVQPKLSLDLQRVQEKSRLTIVGLWGQYILKPQHDEYQFMPETEDLTMHLANAFKIVTCEHALIKASDGSLVYIVKRFDRKDGQKIHVEDFCQLSGFLTEQKYKGSYEKIGKLIRQYCSNKGLDLINFFELVMFSFLTGNNDMHLKNFSVVHQYDGKIRLSPAYDLLNVNLIFKEDPDELALTLNGRKRKLTKNDFETMGINLGISEKARENVYIKFISQRAKVKNLIESSFLPLDWQLEYMAIWDKKIQVLMPDEA